MKLASFTFAVGSLLLLACGSDEPVGTPHATSQGGASSTTTGVGGGGAGGAGGSGGYDPKFQPLVDAVEEERVALGAPGVAVAVVEHGRVTFARGFGSKDPNADVPVLPTTLFHTGSVQKMLTATAMLQQVAAGKIDLDAPITDTVPDFDFVEDPTWAPSVHGRHLLSHTSDIVDYLKIKGPSSDAALETFLLGSFGSVGYLMAPAGSFWNYSNPNFMLAGWLVEKTSGQTYRDYMEEHVYAPLGMTRTLQLPADVIADGDYALGKSGYPGLPEVIAPDTYDNAWARPAGYVYSNVLDLAQFVAFLAQGNEAVLPAAEHDAMQVEQVDTQLFFDTYHYGYALFVLHGAFFAPGEYRPLPIVTHGGDIPGFAADVWWIPSMDLGMVFMANADGAHFGASVVKALETLGTPPEPIELPDPTPTAAQLASYAGTYYDAHNVGTIVVTVDGAALHISMPDVDAAGVPYDPVLVPMDPRNFLLGIQGTQLGVTFIDDGASTSRWFRTRAFVGDRSASPPPPPPPPTTIDASELAARLERARFDARVPELRRWR